MSSWGSFIIVCYTKPIVRKDTLYEVRGNAIIEASPTLIARCHLRAVPDIPTQKLTKHLRDNGSGGAIPVKGSERIYKVGKGKITLYVCEGNQEGKETSRLSLRFPHFFNKPMAQYAALSIMSRQPEARDWIEFARGRQHVYTYPPDVYGEAWYSDNFIEPQNTDLAKWSGYALCYGVNHYQKHPHKAAQR